jgi:hypothetical protein
MQKRRTQQQKKEGELRRKCRTEKLMKKRYAQNLISVGFVISKYGIYRNEWNQDSQKAEKMAFYYYSVTYLDCLVHQHGFQRILCVAK